MTKLDLHQGKVGSPCPRHGHELSCSSSVAAGALPKLIKNFEKVAYANGTGGKQIA